jgi:hypothetical protein
MKSLNSMFLVLLITSAIALGFSSPVIADHHESGKDPGMAEKPGKRVCHADVQKFCKEEMGHGVGKCLDEHVKELSPECAKEHLARQEKRKEMESKLEELKVACDADVKALCADLEKGQGRIMKCLKENESKVSGEKCKAALAAMPKKPFKKHRKHRRDEADSSESAQSE